MDESSPRESNALRPSMWSRAISWRRPEVEIAGQTLRIMSAGREIQLRPEEVGHIEIRDHRTVTIGYGGPDYPPAPLLSIPAGKLHAEDRFDQLDVMLSDAGHLHSKMVEGVLSYSRPWTLDELFPWQRDTEEIAASLSESGAIRVAATAHHRFLLDAEIVPGWGRQLVVRKLVTDGDPVHVLRIVPGRVLGPRGMVLGTFQDQRIPNPLARERSLGFRLDLANVDAEGVAQQVQFCTSTRVFSQAAPIGDLAPTADGCRLKLRAATPEVVALVALAVERFLQGNVPQAAPLRHQGAPCASILGGRKAMALRLSLFLIPFSLFIASMFVLSASQVSLSRITAAMIPSVLGFLIPFVVIRWLLRHNQVDSEHCQKGRFGVHVRGSAFQVCTGFGTHGAFIPLSFIGHLAPSKGSLSVSLANGARAMRIARARFSWGKDETRRFQSLLDERTSFVVRSEEQDGAIRCSRPWDWNEFLVDAAETRQVTVFTRRFGLPARVRTAQRHYVVSGLLRKSLFLNDRIGRDFFMRRTRSRLLFFNGMVLASRAAKSAGRSSWEVSSGGRIEIGEDDVRLDDRRIATICRTGGELQIRFEDPASEVLAVALVLLAI